MIARLAAAALLVAAATGGTATASPVSVCRPTDGRLTELSGLAVGIASRGVLYVHNDSGDTARFFALDARTCAVLAKYTVPGAENVDWEDVAVARDAAGVPSVWLADIGDNLARRDSVALYRVDEPAVDRRAPGAEHLTVAPQVWRLRYPDGPHDAESLAVTPGGHAFVITKDLLGRSTVYAVPAEPGATIARMTDVGAIRFRLTATPGGPNIAGRLTATGAAVSADGTGLAVRTYTDVDVWSLRGRDLRTAIAADPLVVPVPGQRQGEGVAVDGARLLVDSEGLGEPIEAASLPAARPASSTPGTSRPATARAGASASSPGPSQGSSREPAHAARWLVVAAAIVALGGGGWLVRRARGAPRRS